MSHSAEIVHEQLNYGFLLLAHLICADGQIHSQELKYLYELGDCAKLGQQTKDEMEKILAQDEHHLPFDYVVRQVPLEQHTEVMGPILALAHVDGCFAPLERETIHNVSRIWNHSSEEIDWLTKKAQVFADNRIEQLRQDTFLEGIKYEEAIERCNTIAREDYKYAEVALNQAQTALDDLVSNLQQAITQIQPKNGNGKATSAKEVANKLKTSQEDLNTKIVKEMEGVRETFLGKQRALDHFSIAFMGKTKAGKSTLHAVITGEGWEAIGVGKQRTTRLNRVYEWKHIRIIDTPGIGAPGGQSDEEIAESIIDESDVICYVVTNDSIQESEFQFLKLLKEKAKPLIVLLNLKHNLRDSRRLEHFLKNPNKLFSLEGKSGIGGHIERIRRYAQQHYANDYFDIVPAMLLAAQLSNEPEHKERKEKLYKASRIQDFLDSIRESLIKHGAIRRSQTFLGSTVGAIESPYNWLTQQVEDYQQLTNTLENKRQTIQKEIEKARKDALEYLEQQIEETFKDAFNAIPSFAERYWDASEKAMNDGWKTKLDSIGFEKRLKNAYEKAGEKFKQEVEEILKELGKELQLISKLMGSSFKFNRQDSDTFLKHAFAIGGSILGLIGGVLVFSNPVGWAFIAAGTIFSITSNFFKSKADKRKEAVLKISVSLRKQLDDGKKTVLKKTKDEFKKYCDSSTNSINTYFEELIAGLNAITAQLQVAKSQLDNTANYLNRAYAKRIIDWGSEQYETLNNESINKTIAEVERDFGSSLKIQTLSKYQLKRSQDEIKHVLQEDIYVQSLK